MTQHLPEPNLACVAGAAFVLADMTPANAAAGVRMIREALHRDLQAAGWAPAAAEEFALTFCEQVAEQLQRVADAAARLH